MTSPVLYHKRSIGQFKFFLFFLLDCPFSCDEKYPNPRNEQTPAFLQTVIYNNTEKIGHIFSELQNKENKIISTNSVIFYPRRSALGNSKRVKT